MGDTPRSTRGGRPSRGRSRSLAGILSLLLAVTGAFAGLGVVAAPVALAAPDINGYVGTWSKLSPGINPPARTWPAMAYDAASGQIVMFGGLNFGTGSLYGDTRVYVPSDPNLWSGGDTSGPSHRFGASMAYDPDLGTVVLFGGSTGLGSGLLNDTWIWHGDHWTQLQTPSSPSPRVFASLAFDQTTGRLVLFGGEANRGVFPSVNHPSQELGDTWVFDGTTWTQVNTPGPAGRALASLAYDQATGQLILFGGAILGSGGSQGNLTFYRWFSQQDTWRWTGYQWQKLSPSGSPPSRFAAAMDFDAATGQLVLFGGFNDSTADLGDSWTWDGSNWTQLNPLASPDARDAAGMAYEPATGQLVLFGGESDSGTLGDTWTFAPPNSGEAWSEVSTSGPPARSDAAMAFDARTGQFLLFGGQQTDGTVLDDTWAWNGSAWANADPFLSRPPARTGASMAFDPASGELILFGGKDSSGNALDDTWIWSGDEWNQLVTTTRPPARYDASLAFDQASGQLILFGGATGSGVLSDTWNWDGTSWSQLSSATTLTARSRATMSFFYPTGQLVLMGGQAEDGSWLSETDAWSPATGWQKLLGVPLESPETDYDQATGQMLIFGAFAAGSPPQYVTGESTLQETAITGLSLNPAPGPRFDASMAYDPATGQLVLFGGKDADGTANAETWVLFPTEDYNLTAAPASGEYSGTITLTATLTYGGVRVPGQTIQFALLDNLNVVCGGYQQPSCPTTDANGVATLANVSLQSYTKLGVGTYPGCGFPGGISAFFPTGPNTQVVGCGDLTIAPEATRTSVTQAAPAGPVYGQPVTFTVTVFHSADTMTPSGSVAYTVACGPGSGQSGRCLYEAGTTQVDSSGQATFTTTVPLPGSRTAFPYAVFTSSNPNIAGSESFDIPNSFLETRGVYINPANTTSSVSVDKNAVNLGQSVTLTATVAPDFGFTPVAGIAQPTGTVTFYDGTIDAAHQLGTATLSTDPNTGTTTASLGVSTLAGGTHTILAAYTGGYDPNTDTGDRDYNQSASASGVTVLITTPTTTTLASSLNPSMTGNAVTYTAAVSPAPDGGTVAFQDAGSAISGCGAVTVNSGQATCTVTYGSTGSHSISASYGGTSLYLPSAASPLTQQVDTNLSTFPKTSSGAYDLSGQNLSGAYLVNANLAGALASKANLKGANLSGANLSGAYLVSANLNGAKLSGANLSGANLTQANLNGADLSGANLTNANLSQTNLVGVTGLTPAMLSGVVWNKTTCPDGTSSNKDGGTCQNNLTP